LRWSIEDTGSYVFNSEIGLRIRIIERMQASVQFNIDQHFPQGLSTPLLEQLLDAKDQTAVEVISGN
jgi:hypothetical protein